MARHLIICLVQDKPRKIYRDQICFLYIYKLDSALRDSAFLIARTFGRVPHKSSEKVFQISTKVLVAIGSVPLINYKLAHNVFVLLVLIASRTSECSDESLHMTIL